MPIELLEDRIAPATVTVTSLKDSGPGTLRAALDALGAGANVINFAPKLHGTIVLQSPLPTIVLMPSESVAIQGVSASRTIIDGHKTSQILSVYYDASSSPANPAPSVTLSGLTLEYGKSQAGGALLINAPDTAVTANQCIFSHNEAIGAASIGASNGSAGQGGAIDVQAGSLVLFRSTVSGNIAQGGAAPTNYIGGSGMGGGIYVGQYGSLTLEISTISGNKAIGGAGLAGAKGIAGAKGAPGQDGGNGTDGYNGGYGGGGFGGGIFNAGTVSIQSSTISTNSALGGAGGNGGAGANGGTGGAAFTSGGTHFAAGAGGSGGNGGNGSTAGNGLGGGISSGLTGLSLLVPSTLTIENSTISGNTAKAGVIGKAGAAGRGGSGGSRGSNGIAGSAGVAGISSGGGLYSYGGYLTVSQATFGKNTATQGGGLYLNQDISTSINNSTIGFNKALAQGGGIFAVPDTNNDAISLISTIVSQNISIKDSDVAGSIVADHSLIQNQGDAVIAATNDIIGKSALLGALGHHGGTTEVMLQSKSSPAIGAGIIPAGTILARDQRGSPRSINGEVDIGAVEVG